MAKDIKKIIAGITTFAFILTQCGLSLAALKQPPENLRKMAATEVAGTKSGSAEALGREVIGSAVGRAVGESEELDRAIREGRVIRMSLSGLENETTWRQRVASLNRKKRELGITELTYDQRAKLAEELYLFQKDLVLPAVEQVNQQLMPKKLPELMIVLDDADDNVFLNMEGDWKHPQQQLVARAIEARSGSGIKPIYHSLRSLRQLREVNTKGHQQGPLRGRRGLAVYLGHQFRNMPDVAIRGNLTPETSDLEDFARKVYLEAERGNGWRRDLLLFTKTETAEVPSRRNPEETRQIDLPRWDDHESKISNFDIQFNAGEGGATYSLTGDAGLIAAAVNEAAGILVESVSRPGSAANLALQNLQHKSQGKFCAAVYDDMDRVMDLVTTSGMFSDDIPENVTLRFDAATFQVINNKYKGNELKRRLEGLAVLYSLGMVYAMLRRAGENDTYSYEMMLSYYNRDLTTKQKNSLIYLLKNTPGIDAQGHLLNLIEQSKDFKGPKQIKTAESREFVVSQVTRAIQLAKMRCIAGEPPFGLRQAEDILRKAANPYTEEVNNRLFDLVQSTYDEDYAGIYYRRLTRALRDQGYEITAQRGSRVAHTQGTILSGARRLMDIGKIRAEVDNLKRELAELRKFVQNFGSELPWQDLAIRLPLLSSRYARGLFSEAEARSLIDNLDTAIDDIEYHCDNEEVFYSHMAQLTNRVKAACGSIMSALYDKQVEIARQTRDVRAQLRRSGNTAFDDKLEALIPQIADERAKWDTLIKKVDDAASEIEYTQDVLTIFIQRPSRRSAHIIPRVLTGSRVYIERDPELDKARQEGMANLSVAMSLNEVGPHISVFAENASVTVALDKRTTAPYIDWPNVEEVVQSSVPAVYQAIRAAEENGWPKFVYRLETTVYAGLASLVQGLLEEGLTDMAAIEENPESERLRREAQEKVAEYRSRIVKAAEEVIKHYGLENEVQEYMRQERVGRDEAVISMLFKYGKDAGRDAMYIAVLEQHDIHRPKGWQFSPDACTKLIGIQPNANELKAEASEYLRKYITFAEITARREVIAKNRIDRSQYRVSSRKGDPHQRFSFVAQPSRIWFGGHEVASVTSDYGQIVGSDDPEAVQRALKFIERVNCSLWGAVIFQDSTSAGFGKVIENLIRDIEHCKATMVGFLAHSEGVNARTVKYLVEQRKTTHFLGWAAATVAGYCLTKEPIFVTLVNSLTDSKILTMLGMPQGYHERIIALMRSVLQERPRFVDSAEWEEYARETLAQDDIVRRYLGDMREETWMPSLELIRIILEEMGESKTAHDQLIKGIIEYALDMIKLCRKLNDFACLARVALMYDTLDEMRKRNPNITEDSLLEIGMQGAYKGEVSDYRENNNYILANIYAHRFEEIRHYNDPEDSTFRDFIRKHIANRPVPLRLRLSDPYCNIDSWMDGHLRDEAEKVINGLCGLKLVKPLTRDEILNYARSGQPQDLRDLRNWWLIKDRLNARRSGETDEAYQERRSGAEAVLESLNKDLFWLLTYSVGMGEDPVRDYQGADVIMVNARHDVIANFFDMHCVRPVAVMRWGKPNSACLIIDTPQQSAPPVLDEQGIKYLLTQGGGYVCADIAPEAVKKMASEDEIIEAAAAGKWAESYLLLLKNGDFSGAARMLQDRSSTARRQIGVTRQRLMQEKAIAGQLGRNTDIYNFLRDTLTQLAKRQFSVRSLDFASWLALGGRWLLNGRPEEEIRNIQRQYEEARRRSPKGTTGDQFIRTDEANVELLISPKPLISPERLRKEVGAKGGTKESPLVVREAASGIELRLKQAMAQMALNARRAAFEKTFSSLANSVGNQNFATLYSNGIEFVNGQYFEQFFNTDPSVRLENEQAYGTYIAYARMAALALLDEVYSGRLSDAQRTQKEKDRQIIIDYYSAEPIDRQKFELMAGDLGPGRGVFGRMMETAGSRTGQERERLMRQVEQFGEMMDIAMILDRTLGMVDENAGMNVLSDIYDSLLNYQWFEVPPNHYHYSVAGHVYGFDGRYFADPEKLQQMFDISYRTNQWAYRYLRRFTIERTVMRNAPSAQQDALLGIYSDEKKSPPLIYTDRNKYPQSYVGEAAEHALFWECFKAMRDMVTMVRDRRYSDTHPVPGVFTNVDPAIIGLPDRVVVGLVTNVGTHSHNLLSGKGTRGYRDIEIDIAGTKRRAIAVTVPYPYRQHIDGSAGETSADAKKPCLEYAEEFLVNLTKEEYDKLKADDNVQCLGEPLNMNGEKVAEIIDEGVTVLIKVAPGKGLQIDCAVNHFTSQYHTAHLGVRDRVPQAWSTITQGMMYSKAFLPILLEAAGVEGIIPQTNWMQLETKKIMSGPSGDAKIDAANRANVRKAVRERLENFLDQTGAICIVVKASKGSAGHGQEKYDLREDYRIQLDKAVKFAADLSEKDDVVIQIYLPTEGQAVFSPEFLEQEVRPIFAASTPSRAVVSSRAEATPLYFSTRCFFTQAWGLNDTQLNALLLLMNTEFKANVGWGALAFEGTPGRFSNPVITKVIMDLYHRMTPRVLAAMSNPDVVKEYIANYAPQLDREALASLPETDLAGVSYAVMLSGMADYIPYFVYRNAQGQERVVYFSPNQYRAGEYRFFYYEKVRRGRTFKLEEVPIAASQEDFMHLITQNRVMVKLGIPEFNSGFGQAIPTWNQLKALGVDPAAVFIAPQVLNYALRGAAYRHWQEHPNETRQPNKIISLSETALSDSADYTQIVEAEKKRIQDMLDRDCFGLLGRNPQDGLSGSQISALLINFLRRQLIDHFGISAEELAYNIANNPNARTRYEQNALYLLWRDAADFAAQVSQAGNETTQEAVRTVANRIINDAEFGRAIVRTAIGQILFGDEAPRIWVDPQLYTAQQVNEFLPQDNNFAVVYDNAPEALRDTLLLKRRQAQDAGGNYNVFAVPKEALDEKCRAKSIFALRDIGPDGTPVLCRIEMAHGEALAIHSAQVLHLFRENEQATHREISKRLRAAGIIEVNPNYDMNTGAARLDDKSRTDYLLSVNEGINTPSAVEILRSLTTDAQQAQVEQFIRQLASVTLEEQAAPSARESTVLNIRIVAEPRHGTESGLCEAFEIPITISAQVPESAAVSVSVNRGSEQWKALMAHMAKINAGEDDVILQRRVGNLILMPGDSETNRYLTLRVMSRWNGNVYEARSGFAQLSTDLNDPIAGLGKGGGALTNRLAGDDNVLRLGYINPQGEVTPSKLDRGQIEGLIGQIRRQVVLASDAVNAGLSEESRAMEIGWDANIEASVDTAGNIQFKVYMLKDGNARPAAQYMAVPLESLFGLEVPAQSSTNIFTALNNRLVQIAPASAASIGEAVRALTADRPEGQTHAIAAQMRHSFNVASKEGFNPSVPTSIAIGGGRLRIAFMHPDMGRFFGPAWQMPIGAKDIDGRQQIMVFMQPVDDNRIHLYVDNPVFREKRSWIPADLPGLYPEPTINDDNSYEAHGTKLAEDVLSSLGYYRDEQLKEIHERGKQTPPIHQWASANMRRPFSLLANALASLRTLRDGPEGERVQKALGRKNFRGLRIHISGNIPRGGFASSSAFTIAILNAINALYNLGLSGETIITVACRAEYGTGVRAGSLDHKTIHNGKAETGTLISSNRKEDYREIGSYPVPTDTIEFFFPYTVDRDREAWQWSGGLYASGSSPSGRLTAGEVRKMTGKSAEIAAILLHLPLNKDFFPEIEEDLVDDGILTLQLLKQVYEYLRQVPLLISYENLCQEINNNRQWYAEQLILHRKLTPHDAEIKANEDFESLFAAWHQPILKRTTDDGEIVEESGVPLRAMLAYLFGEVATNLYLINHPDEWINCVSHSQLGDRCVEIDLTRLPSKEEMLTALPWEEGLRGPQLMQAWLDHYGAKPFNYNVQLDDNTLDERLRRIAKISSSQALQVESAQDIQLHLLRGGNFFRGLPLIDLIEAMLKKAFGEDAVAVRINGAGQGDYFQVHVDKSKANPKEVKDFIKTAVYERFGLAADIVEVYPGGGTVSVRLGGFGETEQLIAELRRQISAPAAAASATGVGLTEGPPAAITETPIAAEAPKTITAGPSLGIQESVVGTTITVDDQHRREKVAAQLRIMLLDREGMHSEAIEFFTKLGFINIHAARSLEEAEAIKKELDRKTPPMPIHLVIDNIGLPDEELEAVFGLQILSDIKLFGLQLLGGLSEAESVRRINNWLDTQV